MTFASNPTFLDLTNKALAEIWDYTVDYHKDHLLAADYVISRSPGNREHEMTGVDRGKTLLGMYEWQGRPKVTLFSDNITRTAAKFGGLYAAIKDVLWHEIYEHHFGYDHTKETIEAGLVPAYAIDDNGNRQECVPCMARANQ